MQNHDINPLIALRYSELCRRVLELQFFSHLRHFTFISCFLVAKVLKYKAYLHRVKELNRIVKD